MTADRAARLGPSPQARSGPASTAGFEVGLAELAEILSAEPPPDLPTGPRRLAARLREDDTFARGVWSHPMYGELVSWARDHYPRDHQAWEDMAVYALGRASLFRGSVLSVESVWVGMLGTAAWVRYRGRELERLDRREPSIESIDLVAEPLLPSATEPERPKPVTPIDYLTDALGGEVPGLAGDVLDRAWEVAHEHYMWLADQTGLRGEALLAAGQAHGEVNRYRRLSRRLPAIWPTATRKAVVQLLAGTPRNSGLLLWWATTPSQEVPVAVRSRWRGLVAVMDPEVGRMADPDRRILREQAQRWQPPAPSACDPGIAV